MHDFSPRQTDSTTELIAAWQRERPDIETWPIAILVRILRLSSRLTQFSARWLAQEGLSWEAFSLIVTLRRQGAPYAMRPGDILRESLLTSGAVTNRVDRVEAMGLVARRRDPHDRRGVVVHLTPAGLERADLAIRAHADHLAEILGGLTETERAGLDALLSRTLLLVEQGEASGG